MGQLGHKEEVLAVQRLAREVGLANHARNEVHGAAKRLRGTRRRGNQGLARAGAAAHKRPAVALAVGSVRDRVQHVRQPEEAYEERGLVVAPYERTERERKTELDSEPFPIHAS